MLTRLPLVIFTLMSSLLMMTETVRAEQTNDIYLAANSVLEITGMNARDQDNALLTPEDQKETESDMNITADIRRALVKNDSRSVNAQNIKIITRNGVVTLRGPVENRAEKNKLHDLAQQTPGVIQVNNNLENKAP